MRRVRLLISLSTLTLCIFLIQCKQSKIEEQASEIVKGRADNKAAKIASDIMTAMGGEEKWNNLHYVSWTFFGSRQLVWDKIGGRVRIDSPRDTSIYLIDLYNNTGRYSKNGIEVTDQTELAEKIKRGTSIWINDSYWLVMPFKLRDEGVNLKYMREDTMSTGVRADVLELTFKEVGDTPDNKYEVYVDATDNLIKQWDFYGEASQKEPSRSWPWDNYEDFDGLLISSDRSDQSGPSNVQVYATLMVDIPF